VEQKSLNLIESLFTLVVFMKFENLHINCFLSIKQGLESVVATLLKMFNDYILIVGTDCHK